MEAAWGDLEHGTQLGTIEAYNMFVDYANRVKAKCCRSLYPARFSPNNPRGLCRVISLLPDYVERSENPCSSSLSR